jgi:pimeloyl-ACP methyl ester carboxylesterase
MIVSVDCQRAENQKLIKTVQIEAVFSLHPARFLNAPIIQPLRRPFLDLGQQPMTQLAKINAHRQANIDIDGHRLVARVFNADKSSVPLIFLHGIGGSIDFWNAGQPEIVTSDYRWTALSLPGHYPATFPAGYTRADLSAASLTVVTAQAIRKLTNGEPAILVGHSTGGWLALCVAAHSPELVRSVVSVAGFAHGYWTGVLRLRQMIAQWGLLGRGLFHVVGGFQTRTLTAFRDGLDELVTDHAAIQQSPMLADTLDSMYASVRSLSMDTMFTWYSRMPHVDISDQLPHIQAPVLQIHGDRDRIVPYSQGQHIAETVPQAELLTLPGCGHMIPWEREADYQSALTRWLMDSVE